MNKIKDLLKDSKNLVIINVTRDYFFNLEQKPSINNYYFMPYEIKLDLLLTKTHIDNIFIKLDETIKNFSKKLIVIVFQEYFFSENAPMNLDLFNYTFDLCKKFTTIHENSLLFVNLLHTLKISNSNDLENNIKTYSNAIGSKIEGRIFWKPPNIINLLPNNLPQFFRNCTYVFMFGKELYYHKKSSYSNEISIKINYDIGFFEKDEINPNLKEDEIELAKLINNTFQLHICLDFKNDYEKSMKNLIEEKDNDFYFNDEYKNEVNKLIELYKSLKIIKNKNQGNKFYIIQSNYFNLNSTEKFDDGSFVIKSDPLQQMVFKVKRSKEVKELINNICNLSEIYKNNNEYLSNNYMLEGIAQSKEKKISTIYKVNFIKEIESFDCDKVKIPLNFEGFKLNAILNIYDLNKH